MDISLAMWKKAEALMTADCLAAYKKANPNHNPHGKRRAKPYVTPQRCVDLAAAMNKNDAEQLAAIMMYRFGVNANEP